MQLEVFRNIFPKSILPAQHVTKNNSVILKTYNQSDMKQLHVCAVRLRYRDKYDKCRFFVVPGDDPILLGMPRIEMLNILKIMCEVIGDPHESRKLNSQTIEASNSHSCKMKTEPQRTSLIKLISMIQMQTFPVISGTSSAKSYNEFSDFLGKGYFEGTFSLQVKDCC